MKRVIAICGYKRSGKDTIAEYLRNQSDGNAVICKIANKLKEACSAIFGFTPDQLETDMKDSIDPVWQISPRSAMQYLGTDIMQYDIQRVIPGIGRNFWIKRFIYHIETIHKTTPYIIISDLRFKHEYEELYKLYGSNLMVIKVYRNENIDENIDTHISEREWKDIPHSIVVNNNSTLNDLYSTVDNIKNAIIPNSIPMSKIIPYSQLAKLPF